MERFDYTKVSPGTYQAMLGLEKYLHQSGLEESLLHLIKLRASQINGCAYCLDMHWKDLKSIGEQANVFMSSMPGKKRRSTPIANVRLWRGLMLSPGLRIAAFRTNCTTKFESISPTRNSQT